MRILFISSLYATKEISGAEKIVKILAEAVAERGHEAVVLSLSLDGRDHSFQQNGVEVRQVKQRNIYSPWPGQQRGPLSRAIWHGLDIISPAMVGEVGAVLERERPDLIHSHLLAGFTLAPWLAARRRGIPIVHTIHDLYLMCPNTGMYRKDRPCAQQCTVCRCYRWPHLRISSYVDAPVSPSNHHLERHLNAGFFRNSPIPMVIPNGYDGPLKNRIQKRLGRSLRFGFIGRLQPAKGITLLLETFVNLPREDCELIIGGRGETAFDEWLRSVYHHPRITFLGQTTPVEFFDMIDILVVPSLLHENFPLVILEAFGHGIPVVASRRGGNIEMVEDGKNGYLFEPERPEELPTILARLIDDPSPLPVMQDACLDMAWKCSRDTMVERYLSVYREAAELRKQSL